MSDDPNLAPPDAAVVPRELFVAEVKDKFGVVFDGANSLPLQREIVRA